MAKTDVATALLMVVHRKAGTFLDSKTAPGGYRTAWRFIFRDRQT
ncbi:hypothetical protein [Paenibacillus maysiensis]|nr:hypothetical protein [Paenibacillus maysiensis]